MEYIYICIVLALISLSTFLFFEWREKYILSFFFKAISSLFFIVLTVCSYYYLLTYPIGSLSIITYQRYFIFVLIGLSFGFIGDLVLALRTMQPEHQHPLIILLGTTVFGIGHLLYIIALSRYMALTWIVFLFSVMITAIIFVSGHYMKLKFGKLYIPSVIYSFLLFLFVGQVIFGYHDISNKSFYLVLLIGSVLFAFSDIILSQIYYNNKETKRLKTLNLLTYYFAQYLISLSVLVLVVL